MIEMIWDSVQNMGSGGDEHSDLTCFPHLWVESIPTVGLNVGRAPRLKPSVPQRKDGGSCVT